MSVPVPLQVPGWRPPEGWVIRRIDLTSDYPTYLGDARVVMDVALTDLKSGADVAVRMRQGEPDFRWLDQYLTLMRAMPQTVCAADANEPLGRGW